MPTRTIDWLALYQQSLLNPKVLKKFGIKLNHLEYENLCYKFKDEPRIPKKKFSFYDEIKDGFFIKYLELSDDTILKVKSRNIEPRIKAVLREKNILTYYEYLTAVTLNKFNNELYTRNY